MYVLGSDTHIFLALRLQHKPMASTPEATAATASGEQRQLRERRVPVNYQPPPAICYTARGQHLQHVPSRPSVGSRSLSLSDSSDHGSVGKKTTPGRQRAASASSSVQTPPPTVSGKAKKPEPSAPDADIPDSPMSTESSTSSTPTVSAVKRPASKGNGELACRVLASDIRHGDSNVYLKLYGLR